MPDNRTMPRQCEVCGKDFMARVANVKMGYGRFCSRSCYYESLYSRGDRWLDKDGYVILRGPRGSRGIPEHRAVMERELGRPLRSDEDVHHLSGYTTDNRPWNLVVMTHGEHMRLHHKGKKMVQWSRYHDACIVCDTTDHSHQARGMCTVCYMNTYYTTRK